MAGHVYVSYCRQDVAYVRRLVEHLISLGLPVWVDQHVAEGARWQPTQEPAIQTAAAVLVVMTPEAQATDRVLGEILAAHRFVKPIVPLLLSGKPFFSQGAVAAVDVTRGQLPDDTVVDRLGQLCGTPIQRADEPSPHPRRGVRAPIIVAAAAALALVAVSGVAVALSRPSSNQTVTPTPGPTAVATLADLDPTTGLPSVTPTPSGKSPSNSPSTSRRPTTTTRPPGSGGATNPPPPAFPTSLNLTAAQTSLDSGGNTTATVHISGPYPSDLTVSLSSDGPVTVPASVTIPAGLTTATFIVSGSSDTGGTATVHATLQGLSDSVTITVAAPPPPGA
jgi:TIR domain